jgi:putative transposase
MPSKRVAKDLNSETYFMTMTVKNWYYILDRHHRWEILRKSLQYCIDNKALKVQTFVFMINHIHLIIQCPDVAGFIRDFKKYTSRELMNNIRLHEPHIARLFEDENGKHNIWQKTNMPEIVRTQKYFMTKKRYIELNPVRRGYVELAEHWIYSSAHIPCLINIEDINSHV